MSRLRTIVLSVAAIVALLTAGCASEGEPRMALSTEANVPPGFEATVWAEGLSGPTQMLLTPEGDLIVAELNGAENDGTGRVLRVSAADRSARIVLQENLDKPTGIALTGETLWIMERDRLSSTSLDPGADRTVFADDLPNNGRSQGTLTVLSDGSLLFDTSGSKRGRDRVDGSATIFQIADAAGSPDAAMAFATGFKHAYAQVEDSQGRLWSVEMTDGTFDDQRASDELVQVFKGDDAGWPQCVDDNRPVIEFGGTVAGCATAPRSHALFGAGATPTSVVISPWNPEEFLVALWLRGEVVAVPVAAGEEPHVPRPFITDMESPQHLLVDGEQLLLSDHDRGTIFAVRQTS